MYLEDPTDLKERCIKRSLYKLKRGITTVQERLYLAFVCTGLLEGDFRGNYMAGEFLRPGVGEESHCLGS